MSQHDFNIANQSFPATRTDINDAILAIVSNSSGDTEPSTTYANQWWYETDTNILKIRNEANDGWVDVITLDASMTASASELSQLDSITRGSILYGNASGETARLAKGGAGTVLTSDGTDIAWAAAAGGGGLEFISSTDVSNAATASFTGFDASKYDSYLFTCGNIVPATDSQHWCIRMSVDGGSNYLSASDSYRTSAYTGITAGDKNYIGLTNTTLGGVSTEGGSLDVRILNPNLNTSTYAFADGILASWDNTVYGGQGRGGKTNAATVVNAVQFFFLSGNIASGTITMYGMVNS
jgi:hypothetical protein